ncbi:hypothetical protein ANN_26924 [Periplaneta americana]|uniref:CCHC-type domain-containing protein n=1 Tax=Periplaneta americana TaxID=6978 RepID=A0ABQ8RWQ3_PERAM|nr:hypothetical protein ANN_26924 [Periplaneta americana]
MEIKQHIPGSVKIAGFPAQITYVGQPQLCFVCHEPGHLKEECPKRKTKLNVSVQPRKLLLSDVVAGISECSAPASHAAEHTESTLTTEQIHDEQPDPMELEETYPASPTPVIKSVEKSNDVNYLKATEDFVEQTPEEQDNKAEYEDMEDKIQHQEKHPAEEDTTMSVDGKAQEQQGKSKQNALSQFIRDNNIDVLLLQEVNLDNFSFLGPQFDFVVHTGENNRDTAIIYRAGFIVKNIEGHPSGRVTSLTLNDTHIVNVYLPSGTNYRTERENFHSRDLPFFLRHRYNQLILGGDWNCVLQAKNQSGSYNPSPVLKTLVTDLNLIDTWENKHENNVTFTFHRQNNASRLDRFYINEAYTNDIYNVTVIPTPFSAQDCVLLSTITGTLPPLYGRSYWKLNNSLLQLHDANQNFNDHFENIKRRVKKSPLSIMQKWIRIIKPGIKSFYQTAGYLRAQESRATLQFYYQMLNELYSRHKTEGNKWEEIRQVKRTICTLQEKTMYGVVIRSKVPTINEDEKCALYHLVKEKQKQHVRFITNLQTAAGKTLNTNNECKTEFEKHFTSLYENTNTSQQQTQKLLKHINRHLSVIQQEELQHPVRRGNPESSKLNF